MKKAINKAERNEIIQALVAEASLKSGQALIDKLGVLRKEAHKMLLNRWEDNFPGISRKDQLALLQEGAGTSLTFRPDIRVKRAKEQHFSCAGEFGQLAWRSEQATGVKVRYTQLATRIFARCTGIGGVLRDGINSTSWYMSLNMGYNYPDILAGSQPKYIYLPASELPETADPASNADFLALHNRIVKVLEDIRALLDSADEMYQNLEAALIPVKTAQALAELMPESVKHFPASLTYVKPTKELADPKAINDIRAKLLKGLPI